MAEDANPDNFPERYVRVRGPCDCDEPTHYITLDRGPVSITAPPPVQLEQKTNRQYKDQPEQVKSQLPATAPCRFNSPPRLSSSPPSQLVSPTPAPTYHAKPLALFQRFTIPEPVQFHFTSQAATLQPPPPRCQHNPLPTQLSSAMSNPLLTRYLLNSPAPVTAHRVTNPSAASRKLTNPPPPPPPPPKRQRKKTVKSNRKCKKNRRAVKLIKQHNFHEEPGSQANAGLEAGVPATVDEARIFVDAENARLVAPILAQLSTPVAGSIGGGVVPGCDACRPRSQPKTLSGASLAAALDERRRATLRIALQHLGMP